MAPERVTEPASGTGRESQACDSIDVMNHKPTLVFGTVAVCAVGVGYIAWRHRMHEFPEVIERADFARADSLAAELLEAGQLGREVKVLTAVLAACLVGMILLSRVESGRAIVAELAPQAFGFGSYL